MNQNSNPNPAFPPLEPPRLFPTLISGFNLVARKAYLLLLPIALDLLFWFGPHVKIDRLMAASIKEMLSTPLPAGADAKMFSDIMLSFQDFVSRFNLLTQLSNRPVGVPSLMALIFPIRNPFGIPVSFEVTNWGQATSGILLFGLLGLVLTSLYIGMVARATATPAEAVSVQRAIWEFLQILGMSLLAIVLVFILSIPAILIAWVLFMINQTMASIVISLGAFLLLWLLIPFVFAPHGIYAAGQNAFHSILISGRLVRALYPGVTLFLLAILLISEAMNWLWTGAPDTSWLMAACVFGNAFFSTALIAASFIYYRRAAAWVARPQRITRPPTNF